MRLFLTVEHVPLYAQNDIAREKERELAWQAVRHEAIMFVDEGKPRIEACISALTLLNLLNPADSSPSSTASPRSQSSEVARAVTAPMLQAIAMTVSEAVESVSLVEDMLKRQRGTKIDPSAAVSAVVDVASLRSFVSAAEDRVSVLEATVSLENKKRQRDADARERAEQARWALVRVHVDVEVAHVYPRAESMHWSRKPTGTK